MFDPGKKTFPIKEFRSICLLIDGFVYFLLSTVFKIFFNIANANILDNDVINKFYSNIQLLLGIFITFKLCFSLITYIVSPDKFSDSKVGAGKLIIRVVTSLIMLTLLTPLSGIPVSDAESGSYNEAIKNKGILFGTLQIVEDRILDQNVIGALVLGNTSSDSVNKDYNEQSSEIVSGILKAFIWIPLDSSGQQLCDNDSYDTYNKTSDYATILDYAENEDCGKKYAYSYNFLGSWICGAIFIIIVAGFCVDVAVRLIKLTILRLIAPIPIINYISPESDKNGSFNAWVKMLTKTYLDLFIRIAIIYFVVYVCSTLIGNDIVFASNSFILNSLSKIFIWLGLFIFAKQAPKFFMDMLGIKGDGKGFFSGLGAVAGFGAFTGGLIGSAATGWRASAEENQMAGRTNRFTNFGRNLFSAATSTLGGAVAGGRAAYGVQDGHYAAAIFRAQQQRNALRASHSTLGGRMVDNASAMFTGRSLAQQDQSMLDLNNTAISSINDWKKMVQSEAIKNGESGIVEYIDSATGVRTTGRFNYSQLERALQSSVGDTFTYDGRTYRTEDFGTTVMEQLLDSQTKRYMGGIYKTGGKSYADLIKRGGKLYTQRRKVMFDAQAANINRNLDSYSDIGRAAGDAYLNVSDMSNDLRHIARRANSQANGNNR